LGNALEITRKDDQLTRKYFVLLSDGDDHSNELEIMLDELQRENISVHTIGIGSENSVPIPLARGDEDIQYIENEEGEQIMTLFNEATLRQIASRTNGSFFRSITGHELADVMKQIVDKERRQVGWEQSVDYHDVYVPLLFLSLIATLVLLLKS